MVSRHSYRVVEAMTRAERLEIAQFLADIMQDVQQCSYAEYPDTRDHIAQLLKWIKLLREEGV